MHKCIFKRDFKKFDNEKFIEDLQEADLSNFENVDVNTAYDTFNSKFIDIYNKHVPLKQRKLVKNPAPFMNSKLKKAVYKKRMLHNNYKKYKDSKSWDLYRKQRNIVTKVKRESIKKIFFRKMCWRTEK